jgi:hypothetical protein
MTTLLLSVELESHTTREWHTTQPRNVHVQFRPDSESSIKSSMECRFDSDLSLVFVLRAMIDVSLKQGFALLDMVAPTPEGPGPRRECQCQCQCHQPGTQLAAQTCLSVCVGCKLRCNVYSTRARSVTDSDGQLHRRTPGTGIYLTCSAAAAYLIAHSQAMAWGLFGWHAWETGGLVTRAKSHVLILAGHVFPKRAIRTGPQPPRFCRVAKSHYPKLSGSGRKTQTRHARTTVLGSLLPSRQLTRYKMPSRASRINVT